MMFSLKFSCSGHALPPGSFSHCTRIHSSDDSLHSVTSAGQLTMMGRKVIAISRGFMDFFFPGAFVPILFFQRGCEFLKCPVGIGR